MTKKLMTLLLSASLAVTSITATPARANEDVGKVLAGIAALAIIGTAVNKHKHRKEEKRVTRKAPSQNWAPVPQRRNVKRAPQKCLRNIWTHRGNREVFGARCMIQNSTAQLPSRCLRQVKVKQGPSQFYSKQCLRQNGWRT